ncbi:MFS transporter [Rhodococcus opacus]|nr:MFS transporter [Rhodococcus opacus]
MTTTSQTSQVKPPAHPERSTPSTARAWTVAIVLFVFMLLNWADKAILGLAAEPLMKELGLSASQFGLASSAVFLLFGLSALFTSTLSDRVGTRRLLLVMAVLWSVAMVPVLLVPTLGALIAGRTLLGAAEGPASPLASIAAMKWFPAEKRTLPVSIVVTGSLIGLAVAAPTLSWVISNWGWRSAFILMAALGLIWALVWLVVGKEGPYLSADTAEDTEAAAKSESVSTVKLPWWKLLCTRTWLCFTLGLFAAYWTSALLLSWMPHFLTSQLGFSAVTAGNLVGAAALLCAIAMLLQGLIGDRVMSRGGSSWIALGWVSGGAVLTSGVAMLVFAVLPGNGVVKIVAMLVAFSLCLAVGSAAPNAIAHIIPSQQHGLGLGSYIAFGTSAGVIAPAFTGRVLDLAASESDGYFISFVVSGVLMVAAGGMLIALGNPDRDRKRLEAASTELRPTA